MSDLNTELMTSLLKNESIDEVFRSHLEAAMNDLLKIELTQFLGYEKSSILGYNTGNSRNGFYERDLDTSWLYNRYRRKNAAILLIFYPVFQFLHSK